MFGAQDATDLKLLILCLCFVICKMGTIAGYGGFKLCVLYEQLPASVWHQVGTGNLIFECLSYAVLSLGSRH